MSTLLKMLLSLTQCLIMSMTIIISELSQYYYRKFFTMSISMSIYHNHFTLRWLNPGVPVNFAVKIGTLALLGVEEGNMIRYNADHTALLFANWSKIMWTSSSVYLKTMETAVFSIFIKDVLSNETVSTHITTETKCTDVCQYLY